ncbi:HAD-IB family hydrolase [Vibrio alginolyticus]|uniref:HAD-IB family hydrolase n=1 Tax=Vibrio TaxID=662 RepID=UPI00215F5E23|nr:MULTISPECIES: HAD-IB family hydrolase [Vibrio]MCS0109135.1 HAD-IB family hydrolase [Vibrio alginolyticus]MDW2068638.1 HAD-IB family hydrolase [Vibrio sp. 2096]MDW3139420.1 HAD-IB family hydrolase [Vibrio sp. 2094]
MLDTTKPSLALFDFDGTITREDMFSLFLHYSAYGLRKRVGKVAIMPFYALYKLGVLPARVMRPLSSFIAFSGKETQKIEAIGAQFAHEVIPLYLRPEAMERLAWHQHRSDTIVVVSASLNAYLKPWCEANGYHLLCSELISEQPKLSGFYQQGDCSLERKVSRVKAAFSLDEFASVYAYGDTHEDIPMLKLADYAMLNWSEWRASE